MIQRRTKCRMAPWYSKFLSPRKRFAESACKTGLISRFGSQSETARRGQKIQDRDREASERPRAGTGGSRYGRRHSGGNENRWRRIKVQGEKTSAEEENRSCD